MLKNLRGIAETKNSEKHTMKTFISIGFPGLILSTQLCFGSGLINGSFESPALTTPWQNYTPMPGFGWTVGAGDIDLIGTLWQASDGTQSVDLNGFGPSSIYQDFNLSSAGQWVVKFDMSANPDPAQQGLKTLQVNFGDVSSPLTSLGSFSVSNVGRTHGNMQYVEYTTPAFTGNDFTTYRLEFTSLTGDTSGPVIDNIRLVAVPEPTAISFLGCAAALVALLKTPRKPNC